MRFGIVIMATLFGMAFGGWISGVIFDSQVRIAQHSPTARCGTCSTPVSRWHC